MGHVGAARALPVRGFAAAQGSFLFMLSQRRSQLLKPKGLVVRFCMYITRSCTRRLKIKINRSH